MILLASSGSESTLSSILSGPSCQVSIAFLARRVEVAASGNRLAAARDARYAALREAAAELGASRIAIAHTANDQAETVLMRLIRGSDLRGAAGIPERRGLIVRPLLGVTRDEVLAYARARGLAFAEEDLMTPPRFVVWKHMNGELALRATEIGGVWYRPAFAGAASQLRVNSSALVEPKVLAGEEADALWARFATGDLAPLFVRVSHMGGLLAIPREAIRTLYRTGEGSGARLRIVWPGDPNGKDVEGEEAVRVWKELAG